MTTSTCARRRALRRPLPIVLASAALVSACELRVTNPGPIGDDQLSNVTAIPALVNGMSGDLSFALGAYINRGALGSGELSEAGLFIPEGHYFLGQFIPQDVNADWGNMQTARWTSESGLARMKAVLGTGFESNVNTPRAYLYGGFANRLLGENVCVAVIDGGPAGSDSVYFQRAESLFTRAYTTATALNNTAVATAALGGRATVRAWQGNWTGAVADAAQVPVAFAFNAIFSTNTTRENLDLVNQTLTRSETSVFGTVYASNNKEPRATWDTVRTGAAVTKGANGTPVFRQDEIQDTGSARRAHEGDGNASAQGRSSPAGRRRRGRHDVGQSGAHHVQSHAADRDHDCRGLDRAAIGARPGPRCNRSAAWCSGSKDGVCGTFDDGMRRAPTRFSPVATNAYRRAPRSRRRTPIFAKEGLKNE
ncbi:MAG: hypothetical protein ACREBE_05195 [bacterium]